MGHRRAADQCPSVRDVSLTFVPREPVFSGGGGGGRVVFVSVVKRPAGFRGEPVDSSCV